MMENQMRRRPYAMLTLGVSAYTVGVFLTAADELILGADHTGIATIVVIVGLGIIAHARRIMP